MKKLILAWLYNLKIIEVRTWRNPRTKNIHLETYFLHERISDERYNSLGILIKD